MCSPRCSSLPPVAVETPLLLRRALPEASCRHCRCRCRLCLVLILHRHCCCCCCCSSSVQLPIYQLAQEVRRRRRCRCRCHGSGLDSAFSKTTLSWHLFRQLLEAKRSEAQASAPSNHCGPSTERESKTPLQQYMGVCTREHSMLFM